MSAAALLYIASLAVLRPFVVFGEETFAQAATGNARPLDVYIDVRGIDPVRESMDLRFDIATGPGPHGTHYDGILHRDVELRVSDGDTEQDFRLRRNIPVSSQVFAAGVRGAVGRYPFDRYASQLVMSARELSSNSRTTVPIRVTVWEGVPAWDLSVTKVRSFERMDELALAVSVHRPTALVFFACVLYGIMVLIAASAITIGVITFVGLRRVEPTLVSALAAMVFALPVLRNLLPGTPPLGVFADVFVLLWAELAVAIGLISIVTAWVQRGSK